MGGSIEVESVPGRGSLFHVELPLKEATEDLVSLAGGESEGEVTGLVPGQPEYRILIVEDQYDNQLLLTRLMKTVGFEVKVAGNGEEAVQIFSEWRPHLIWMDRRMPVMDGMEATEKIRALPGGRDVKIVAVTASAFQEQRAELLAAGMDDFIGKPFRAGEIYECMARQLGIRFTYEGIQEPGQVVQLTPAMLSALPAELLDRLKIALESLDSERISHVIQETASYDVQLQKALLHLADVFDYRAILDACERI
jgi:CheY-like chemotaxis protein